MRVLYVPASWERHPVCTIELPTSVNVAVATGESARQGHEIVEHPVTSCLQVLTKLGDRERAPHPRDTRGSRPGRVQVHDPVSRLLGGVDDVHATIATDVNGLPPHVVDVTIIGAIGEGVGGRGTRDESAMREGGVGELGDGLISPEGGCASRGRTVEGRPRRTVVPI